MQAYAQDAGKTRERLGTAVVERLCASGRFGRQPFFTTLNVVTRRTEGHRRRKMRITVKGLFLPHLHTLSPLCRAEENRREGRDPGTFPTFEG